MGGRSRGLAVGFTLVVLLGACGSDDSGDAEPATTGAPTTVAPTTAPPATVAPTTVAPTTVAPTTTLPAAAFDGWAWELVADGAPWGGRAGLRMAELGGRLYLMGGRTPKQSPIPGDSTIWGDVWASDDGGATWAQVLASDAPGHWAPRAYFQVVVKDGAMVVLGGQDFGLSSNFFNDVWSSTDGVAWQQLTAAAPWAGRAGLSAAVLGDWIYVLAGSANDDTAVIGPTGPARQYFNDVWRSKDGATWEQVTAAAPWEPRAGAIVEVKDGALWLLGGEKGFLCQPQPDCEPPYFNDVWRSTDGATWEQVTPAAGWSPRPGHTCEVVLEQFVCFGGFGTPENPNDVWVSDDGATWTKLAVTPWNAASPAEVRYDFDAIVVDESIITVGGDRETFDFGDPENYRRVDDDVWRFGVP